MRLYVDVRLFSALSRREVHSWPAILGRLRCQRNQMAARKYSPASQLRFMRTLATHIKELLNKGRELIGRKITKQWQWGFLPRGDMQPFGHAFHDDLKERVAEKWEQEGISLEDIAQATGIPLANLKNWLRDPNDPINGRSAVPNFLTFKQLEILAKYFNLPPDHFINLVIKDRHWQDRDINFPRGLSALAAGAMLSQTFTPGAMLSHPFAPGMSPP